MDAKSIFWIVLIVLCVIFGGKNIFHDGTSGGSSGGSSGGGSPAA